MAWSLAGAAVLLQVANVVLGHVWAKPGDSVAEALGVVVVQIAVAAVGAAVASRVPTNPLGWLVLGIALMRPFVGLLDTFLFLSSQQVRAGQPMLPGTVTGLVLHSIVLSVVLVVPFTVVPLLFPDGRLPSRRWRWVVWLTVTAIGSYGGVGVVATMRAPVELLTTDEISAPLLELVAGVAIALAVAAAVLSIGSLVIRWRRSRHVERQQLKWLIGGITTTLLGFVAEVEPVDAILAGVWSGLPDFLGDVTRVALPLSIGVAVTRYRLYEIDRLLHRTVVYATVTALLSLTYLGVVGGLQVILAPLAAGSQFAVAASTLLIAIAFRPLRRGVQERVDRRFNRRRYDAQRIVEAFQASLRNEVDIDVVTRALHAAAARTMEPTHATVWLVRRAP